MLPIWGYLAVTLPLVATPGASTAVVLRNSISGGPRAGLFTAIGCNTGNLCYGLLSAFGFAAALQQWPSAWLVLRVLGVVYLSWLGAVSLARGFRGGVARRPDPARGEQNAWHGVASGFLTNVLNPSLAAFYFIVLPQFIPREAPFARSAMILTAIHVSMALTWHIVWAIAGSTLAEVLSSGWPRRALHLTTGAALLVLAAKVAL